MQQLTFPAQSNATVAKGARLPLRLRGVIPLRSWFEILCLRSFRPGAHDNIALTQTNLLRFDTLPMNLSCISVSSVNADLHHVRCGGFRTGTSTRVSPNFDADALRSVVCVRSQNPSRSARDIIVEWKLFRGGLHYSSRLAVASPVVPWSRPYM